MLGQQSASNRIASWLSSLLLTRHAAYLEGFQQELFITINWRFQMTHQTFLRPNVVARNPVGRWLIISGASNMFNWAIS